MTARKHPPCGYMDETGETICEAELDVIDGRYVCPDGGDTHRLATWDDLSQWTRDHIEFVQTDPAMHRRYFGDLP